MALISTLTDNFNDNSIDAAKWSVYNAGGFTTAETNQQWELTTALAIGSTNPYSITTYDLTGSQATIKVVDAGNTTGLASALFSPLWLYVSDASYLRWYISGNGKIGVWTRISNANDFPWSATYVAATHKYLRIREASGTTYFDYSANGTDWTNAYSLANPFAITAIEVNVEMRTDSAEASTTTAKVDDFNILPSATTIIPSTKFNRGFNRGFNGGFN